MNTIYGYIGTYEEACLIVHASRIGALRPTAERLNTEEREKIESGSIFCFIENTNGMKRWTDGRIWSPSKICGEFLIYQEVPRHMSKNSIKKRKEFEKVVDVIQPSPRRSLREELLDRTTMHKKTVCIKHENESYHIIAYYRPIFSTSSLLDIPYFQKLNGALKEHPELKSNDFLRNELRLGDAFYTKYSLDREVGELLLEEEQRSALEKMAVEMLTMLGKNSQRRMRHLVFQQD